MHWSHVTFSSAYEYNRGEGMQYSEFLVGCAARFSDQNYYNLNPISEQSRLKTIQLLKTARLQRLAGGSLVDLDQFQTQNIYGRLRWRK